MNKHDKRFKKLGAAIYRAAGALPKGMKIRIEVENNGYNVHLETENAMVFASGFDGMASDIQDAIACAIEMAEDSGNKLTKKGERR